MIKAKQKHELVSPVTANLQSEDILLSRTVADQVSYSLREDKYKNLKQLLLSSIFKGVEIRI